MTTISFGKHKVSPCLVKLVIATPGGKPNCHFGHGGIKHTNTHSHIDSKIRNGAWDSSTADTKCSVPVMKKRKSQQWQPGLWWQRLAATVRRATGQHETPAFVGSGASGVGGVPISLRLNGGVLLGSVWGLSKSSICTVHKRICVLSAHFQSLSGIRFS